MKIFILITLFFCVFQLNAQDNQGVINNTGSSVLRAGSAVQSSYGSMAYFYNPKVKVEGSVYLFNNWENNARIYTKDNYTYLLRNINLNLEMNSFVSKVAVDCIYTFNIQNVDKIIIENKIFRQYILNEKKRIFQVVYESSKFALLKSVHVQYVKASANPMINRPNDKVIKRYSYFIYKDKEFTKIKLTKKNVLNLFHSSKLENLKKYVRRNRLSYFIEEDIKRILTHAGSI